MAYAAEGFTKSFLGTLQGLTALERAQLEAEDYRERKAREQETRRAAAETLGRAGTETDFTKSIQTAAGVGPQQARAIQAGSGDAEFDRAVAESATNTMRETAVRKGALPAEMGAPTALKGERYTEGQAYQDYARRLAGIDPEKAVSARIQGLQLEEIQRKADANARADALRTGLNDNLARIQGVAESKGMQGLADAAKEAGLKVQYVEGKNGVGSRINVLGPKGDVLETISSIDTAVSKLQDAAMQDFERQAVALLGPEGLVNYMQNARTQRTQEQRLGLQQQQVDIERGRAETSAALTNAQIANLRSETQGRNLTQQDAAEYRTLRGEIFNLLQNPTTENQAELRQKARLAAVLNPKEVLRETKVKDAEGNERISVVNVFTGEIQEAAREAGIAPPAVVSAARSGVNPVTKKPFTQAEIADFQRKYPSTPWPGSETSAAPAGARTARPSAIPAGTKEYGTLGRLTPLSTLQEAARQGNRSAIEELKRRQSVEEASTMQTPGYNSSGF